MYAFSWGKNHSPMMAFSNVPWKTEVGRRWVFSGFFFFFFFFKYFVCCLLFFLLFLVPLKFMEITVTVSRPCLKLVGISKPKLPQPGSEALMFSKASFTFLAAESGRWYLHCNVYWKYLLQWHQTFTRTYDEPTSPSYRLSCTSPFCKVACGSVTWP